MERIHDFIYRLQIPHKDIFTTVYAVRTPGGDVLFDTGSYDSDLQYTMPFLRQIGITDLKYIVLSHIHTDHAGGLKALLGEFPNACTVCHSKKFLAEYGDFTCLNPNDGDVLLEVLQVVLIPGHSKTCLGLLDRRTGIMLSGDSLQLYGIFGSEKWGAVILYPNAYLQAVEKLRAMDIDQILTAHDYHPYGYWYRGKEAVAKALDACEKPVRHIQRLMAENPDLTDAQIARLYNTSGNVPPIESRVVEFFRKEN